jgi:hypothetical protein
LSPATFRPVGPDDLAGVLALNQAFATELSELDAAGLAALVGHAVRALVAGSPARPEAFLIAFGHETPSQGPNHDWFLHRYDRFLYVDRVAVAAHARGRGLARAAYDALGPAMAGRSVLCCEVNVAPPNPASLRFHQRLGFAEAGRAHLPDRGKTVVYLTRPARTRQPPDG